MHSLSVAQATVASLHALVQRKQATSVDEKLVVDAITALHFWAIPDKRLVPTKLRLRHSVPLRIRIKSSSVEPTLISKRRERLIERSGRYHDFTCANLQHSDAVPGFSGWQHASPNTNAAQNISQPSSFANSGSQLANLSDLSTEPPEGWPKLSNPSSPVVELHPVNAQSGKNTSSDKSVADVQLARKSTEEHVVSTPTSSTRRDGITPSNTQLVHTTPSSPTKLFSKRQRVSRAFFRGKAGFEPEKPTGKPSTSSQGSTRSTDAPPTSAVTREVSSLSPNAQVQSRKTKRISKRKDSVPRRRRPTSPDRSAGPSCKKGGEKDEHEHSTGFEDSPPPSFDVAPQGQPHSAMPMVFDCPTESPTISVTQKSGERDIDGHSVEGHEPANSPGSVVIGSSSYDGCSLDMGCGRTNRTYSDIPSRPSSIVWNGSHQDSIEEPSPDNQRVLPFDTIRETENVLLSELPRPTRGQQQSKSTRNQEESSTLTRNDVQEQRGEKIGLLHQQTTSVVTLEGLDRHSHLKAPKSATASPAFWSVGNAADSNQSKPETKSGSGLAIQHHDQTNLESNLSKRISPVSPEEHPSRDEASAKVTGQRNNSNSLVQANVDEMVVCITSFSKEVESELAHELVMRLGGEVVSGFDTALPHCVVAPIDLQTKEVINSDMVVLLALASRIPVVGMSWLTHCFRSGSWVDFSNFETPSSKVKPSTGVFRGIAATFEGAFSRKNAKRKCVEYRKGVEKLIMRADGVVVDTSGIKEIARKDNTLRLLIQIAYDFENNAISTEPQELSDTGIPMRMVSQAWISACLFSGQCPPP